MVLRGAALSIWKPPTERPRDVDGTIRLVDGAGWPNNYTRWRHRVDGGCGGLSVVAGLELLSR